MFVAPCKIKPLCLVSQYRKVARRLETDLELRAQVISNYLEGIDTTLVQVNM